MMCHPAGQLIPKAGRGYSMAKRDCQALIMVLGLVLFLSFFHTPLSRYNPFLADKVEGRVVTRLITEDGEELWATGRPVFLGDQYWVNPDKGYEVFRIRDNTALLRLLQEVKETTADEQKESLPLAATARKIAIFHTHSAESFVPTQGTHSVWGRGGIIRVGAVFAKTLEDLGFRAIHDRTPHDPHDAGAYGRSRRTASALIRDHQPYALFDVHRDAAPVRAYLTQIDGVDTAQIVIVIGRGNPMNSNNRVLARRLLAVGEGVHPTLVRGIFMGRGSYNQDLDPGMLLLEVGTHLMDQALAERGVTLFAEVLAATVGTAGRSITP